MPTDLKLTTVVTADNPVEGDLELGPDRGVVLISGDEEVLQRLRAKLRSFKGEWFLDENEGIPWFQDIFGKRLDLVQVNAILKRHILSVSGIRDIVEYSATLGANRTLRVKCRVRLNSGTIAPIDEQVP